MSTLNSGSSRQIALGKGRVGNAQVSVRLPGEIRDLLNARLREFAGFAVDEDFLESDVVRMVGRLDLTGNSIQFSAAARGTFGMPLNGASLAGEATAEWESVRFGPIRYHLRPTDGGFGVAASTGKGEVDPPDELALHRSDEPLASVELDFAPVLHAEAQSPVGDLLVDLERAYTRFLSPQNPVDSRLGAPRSDTGSLLKLAKPEGDWKVTAALRIAGNEATFDLRVGADAHRFWHLRSLRQVW